MRFTATLQRPDPGTRAQAACWGFLRVPGPVSRKLPSRGLVSVEGTLNGRALLATLEPDGDGGHWLRLDRVLCTAAGVRHGDEVALDVAPAVREPEPLVPADLEKALRESSASVKQAWSDITPLARRDWIHWITSGKRAETRAIRISKACDMLEKGKRRPCCFDRSGIYSKSPNCPPAGDQSTALARAPGRTQRSRPRN